MAEANVTHVLVPGERALASQVNRNFADLRDFINNEVTHMDGTNALTAFDAVPTFPNDPTAGNQAARKAYVDSAVAAAVAPLAKGVVGVAKYTSSNFVSTTTIDVPGLSVSWSGVAGRTYKVSAILQGQAGSAPSYQANMFLADGSNSVWQFVEQSVTATNQVFVLSAFHVFTPNASGALTYKVRAGASSGIWAVTASGVQPATLLVEDLGVLA